MALQTDVLNRFNVSRQTLLIALACLLLVVWLGRLLVSRYVEYDQKLDQAIESNSMMYQRIKRISANSDDFLSIGSSLKRFSNDINNKKIVKGLTPALSEALFQNAVKELAQSANINIRAIKILPRTTEQGISFLNLSINARGEIRAVKNFLESVESSERFMFFTEVEIKRINRRERRYFYFNAKLRAVTKK